MKIYQKTPVSARSHTEKAEIPLDSESARSFGFAPSGGALRCAPVLRPLDISPPAGETPAAAYRLETGSGSCYALYCASGKTYFMGAAGTFAESAISFSRMPAAVEAYADEHVVLLSDGANTALMTAEGIAAREDIPAFACGAWHYERLWLAAAGEDSVRFSAPGSYADFSEGTGRGGKIAFPDATGEISALVPLGIYLYVFRARGVQRLEARGAERDFSLRDLFGCGGIYAGSAAAAGGKLFWAEEDGIYASDGTRAERIRSDLCGQPLSAASEMRAAAVGRGYALSVGQTLAVIDADGAAYIAAEDAAGLVPYACGALCIRQGKICAFAAQNALRTWTSGPVSAGGRAVLRAVRVRARGRFDLCIASGGGERRISVFGEGTRRYPVNLAGENFTFRLQTEGAGEVYSLSAEYERGG